MLDRIKLLTFGEAQSFLQRETSVTFLNVDQPLSLFKERNFVYINPELLWKIEY